MNQKNLNKTIATVAFIALAGSVVTYSFLNEKTLTQGNQYSTATTTSTPTVNNIVSSYKNGTYQAIGNYSSPGGSENLEVKVTLQNDIIVSAEVTPKATIPASKNFQTIFSENFKQYVVGKKISEIKLDKVSGSSLTPKGFNDALEKIKSSAKV